MAELETVDLIGVEILSAGGPVHGVGSPPEGDFWTPDDLRAMAAADAELGDELKPPNKLGHSDLQALVRNSAESLGLNVSPGEMPAVGWLENVRVNDTGDKLICDILECPKTVAELIDSKAYRTRSVELSKVTSQVTGKVYDWVVTGLAWLGGKMPAVRTLDDVVALYEEQGVALQYQEDGDVELRWIVSYAAGDVIWSPDEGYYSLRAKILEALNGPGDAMIDGRFWVRDIAGDRALVMDYFEDEETAWIVPFTTSGDTVELADREQWTRAAMAWVETAKEYEDRALAAAPARFAGRADSRPVAGKTYTEEARRTFAEATGIEVEKVTDEMLEKAGVASETVEPKTRDLEADERLRKLEEKLEQSDSRSRQLQDDLATERKRNFVDGVLRDGKAELSAREEVEAMYDANPDATIKFFEKVQPNDDWAREYGSSEEGTGELTDDELEKRDLSEREEIARSYGLSVEEVA